jgi:hypothetical protein
VSLAAERIGWRIMLSGTFVTGLGGYDDTVEQGLLWRQSLLDWLRPSGSPKTFDICIWQDSGNTIKDIYRGCRLVGGMTQPTPARNSHQQLEWSLTAQSVYALAYSTYSNGGQPGAGEWETYLYSSGEMANAVPPVGSVTITTTTPVHVYSGLFLGAVETTDASNVDWQQHRFYLPTGGTIRNFQISNAQDWGATAQSTIRVSDTDYQTAGNGISLALGQTSNYAAPGGGTFTVADGTTVYVYWPTGSGHEQVQYRFEVHEE